MRLIDADAFVKHHTEIAEKLHAARQVKLSEFHYTLASIVGNEFMAPTAFPPRWFRVEDKLPEDGERCLVVSWLYPDYVALDTYSNGSFCGLGHSVTHWMVMPTPPVKS